MFLSIIFPLIAVIVLTPLIVRWLNKKGLIKILTDDQVVKSKSTYGPFPTSYGFFYIVFLVAIIAAPLAPGVFLMNFISNSGSFKALHQSLFAPGSLYFAHSTGAFFFGFVVFIGLFFFVGWIICVLENMLLPKRFMAYVYSLLSKNNSHVINQETGTRFFGKLTLWYFIGTLPLIFFALHCYKAVYNDRVISNAFFSISTNTIPFRDIAEVIVSCSVEDYIWPEVNAKTHSGKIISLWYREEYLHSEPMNNQINAIYNALLINNVPIVVEARNTEDCIKAAPHHNELAQENLKAFLRLSPTH